MMKSRILAPEFQKLYNTIDPYLDQVCGTEDRRPARYGYDPMSRQEILASIPIYDSDVAKTLMDECEIVATIHLHTIEFQSDFPN
jgi:hypothetical protein